MLYVCKGIRGSSDHEDLQLCDVVTLPEKSNTNQRYPVTKAIEFVKYRKKDSGAPVNA